MTVFRSLRKRAQYERDGAYVERTRPLGDPGGIVPDVDPDEDANRAFQRIVLAIIGVFAFVAVFAVIVFVLTAALTGRHHRLSFVSTAYARDLGQWDDITPEVRRWFRELKQPDNPTMSCCGEADAYWADVTEIEDQKTIAVITDNRPDYPLGRPHVPIGTRIEVPPHKIKWDRGNPTGHIVIFLTVNRQVLCYVQGNGV